MDSSIQHLGQCGVRKPLETGIRVLATGLGFVEGPVIARSGAVVITSIDHGCLYVIRGEAVTKVPIGGGPSGAVEGADGAIYIAQNGLKGWSTGERANMVGGGQSVGGVQRWANGHIEWVTMDPVSPNDICFGPDGLLYLTDPTRNSARDDGRIWRCDPLSGLAEILTSVKWYPNGIAFGPEDDAVYVANTPAQQVVRFPLSSDGLGIPEIAIRMRSGHPDGIAFDAHGNLVIAALSWTDEPGQLQTWSVDGQFQHAFQLGSSRTYTNVAIGADRRLVATDAEKGQVLQCEWDTPGLLLHPFR